MSETIQEPPGFSGLSRAEQLRYLQALLDQISEHPAEIPVPKSHLKLAEDRLARYLKDPSPGGSVFDVLDRLSQETK